jgi:hypothetical protein
MKTVFDIVTLGIFAGLIVLFLQRSMSDSDFSHDPMWRYLVAAVGCAVSNYLGNKVSVLAGIVLIIGTIGFILYELRPFPQFPRR